MAYYDVAELSGDSDFINRVAACYSNETVGQVGRTNPYTWALDHNWEMASQPGFGENYTYARDTNVPSPGRDAGVITDAQILSAVQSVMNAEAAE